MLIVFTQGFKHTQNHRQLISFAGLAPTQYSSGSSIQGKPRIYKRGGKNLRDVLYMCSMNAMKTNTACKALYDRLRANGKTGKQALVAVMNKLLKQVFVPIVIGIKNNSLYQPNYYSSKPLKKQAFVWFFTQLHVSRSFNSLNSVFAKVFFYVLLVVLIFSTPMENKSPVVFSWLFSVVT